MELKKEKGMANKMGQAPYSALEPTRMSRSVPKGAGGDKWEIPNGAKYGLGEGKNPTRMDRSVPAGKKGTSFSLGNNGPATTSRKDTGSNSYAPKTYGVNGVKGGASGGYGGS